MGAWRFTKRSYTVWWWRHRVVEAFVDGSRVRDGWVTDGAFRETPLHGFVSDAIGLGVPTGCNARSG